MNKEQYIEKFEQDVKKRSRLMRFLLALDQMLNVLLWNGSQDETVSSHIGRRIEAGKAWWIERQLCKALRALDNKHCKKAKGE